MENISVGVVTDRDTEGITREVEEPSLGGDSSGKMVPVGAADDKTTLRDLIDALLPLEKLDKTPTPKFLRENGDTPVVEDERCKVYANGYVVYSNEEGTAVLWLPDCVRFTFYFNKMKDTEKGKEIAEYISLPDGYLESQPWRIPITLIAEHQIEANVMNRKGSRSGTKDYDSMDKGDKDEGAREMDDEELGKEFEWRHGRFGEDPLDAYIRKEFQTEILKSLTGKQREVFWLYYIEGYTQREIARMLNLEKESIRDRLKYVRKKINLNP